jgi:heme/copper-type cytochrome/quinol oxidase subunit 1
VTLPAWSTVLIAVLAVLAAVAEPVRAKAGARPVAIAVVAGAVTVAVFALAAAWLLAFSTQGVLGAPRRSATYAPAAAVRPELLVFPAGAVLAFCGLLRAHRSATTAERAGREVAHRARATNLVITLSGAGLAALGLLLLVA